jgi:hypothetical protein
VTPLSQPETSFMLSTVFFKNHGCFPPTVLSSSA